MKGITLCFLIFCMHAWGQTSTGTAKTSAPCSPAISGSNNTVKYYNSKCNPGEYNADLRSRTDSLANQVVDFAYAREGPSISSQQDAFLAFFNDSLNQNPNGKQEFIEKHERWRSQTHDLFLSLYWTPQIVPLLDELKSAGVDTYLVTKAAATDDILRVGLMLSVIATRIGKKPPFQRVVTLLEAREILREANAAPKMNEVDIALYADKSDPNSTEIADILRKTFGDRWTRGDPVLPLSESDEPNDPKHELVHIIFPSSDWTVNFQGFIKMFSRCEIEAKVDIRPGPQSPMVIKVEIWPDKSPHIDYLDKGLVPPLSVPH